MTKKIFSLSEVNSAVNENDIEEIDLRFITITAKDAEIFSANLEKFTGLKSVNFLHLRFENDQARKIFYSTIANIRTLVTFSFSGCQVNTTFIDDFIEILTKNSSLIRIELFALQCDIEIFEKIIAATIMHNSSLEEFTYTPGNFFSKVRSEVPRLAEAQKKINDHLDKNKRAFYQRAHLEVNKIIQEATEQEQPKNKEGLVAICQKLLNAWRIITDIKRKGGTISIDLIDIENLLVKFKRILINIMQAELESMIGKISVGELGPSTLEIPPVGFDENIIDLIVIPHVRANPSLQTIVLNEDVNTYYPLSNPMLRLASAIRDHNLNLTSLGRSQDASPLSTYPAASAPVIQSVFERNRNKAAHEVKRQEVLRVVQGSDVSMQNLSLALAAAQELERVSYPSPEAASTACTAVGKMVTTSILRVVDFSVMGIDTHKDFIARFVELNNGHVSIAFFEKQLLPLLRQYVEDYFTKLIELHSSVSNPAKVEDAIVFVLKNMYEIGKTIFARYDVTKHLPYFCGQYTEICAHAFLITKAIISPTVVPEKVTDLTKDEVIYGTNYQFLRYFCHVVRCQVEKYPYPRALVSSLGDVLNGLDKTSISPIIKSQFEDCLKEASKQKFSLRLQIHMQLLGLLLGNNFGKEAELRGITDTVTQNLNIPGTKRVLLDLYFKNYLADTIKAKLIWHEQMSLEIFLKQLYQRLVHTEFEYLACDTLDAYLDISFALTPDATTNRVRLQQLESLTRELGANAGKFEQAFVSRTVPKLDGVTDFVARTCAIEWALQYLIPNLTACCVSYIDFIQPRINRLNRSDALKVVKLLNALLQRDAGVSRETKDRVCEVFCDVIKHLRAHTAGADLHNLEEFYFPKNILTYLRNIYNYTSLPQIKNQAVAMLFEIYREKIKNVLPQQPVEQSEKDLLKGINESKSLQELLAYLNKYDGNHLLVTKDLCPEFVATLISGSTPKSLMSLRDEINAIPSHIRHTEIVRLSQVSVPAAASAALPAAIGGHNIFPAVISQPAPAAAKQPLASDAIDKRVYTPIYPSTDRERNLSSDVKVVSASQPRVSALNLLSDELPPAIAPTHDVSSVAPASIEDASQAINAQLYTTAEILMADAPDAPSRDPNYRTPIAILASAPVAPPSAGVKLPEFRI